MIGAEEVVRAHDTAEGTVHPERTIPKALTVGITVVTLCCVALNAVYFYVLPVDRVLKSTRIVADAATALLGAPGRGHLGAVTFSVFGAMTGGILTAPRVYFAMAHDDGLLFRWVSEVHPRFRTPHRAILVQAVWASVLAWSGTYRQLFTRVIFTEWDLLRADGGRIVRVEKPPGLPSGLRRLGYPWIPRRLHPGVNRHRHQPDDLRPA